ncbi:hypothetical protein Cpir12675_004730 [Ceratocystis pirilliformis]|uniref:N(4)-(Beta-N-acetylglucosaminyl)-L-asparaginase n=1 Tax=Ceratocystis pirilliformis TaxID=259994 RepID=A0ABR3YUI9_9PEZI
MRLLHLLPSLCACLINTGSCATLPFVINTWGGPFTVTTDAAFVALKSSATALDAAESGASACEVSQCDGTVGYGGSPDERCETTLDALIMDGTTMNAGAVAGLRRVKNAIGVARRVLEDTQHTLLVGDHATAFALEKGFLEVDLATDESRSICYAWKKNNCQPNFRVGFGSKSCPSKEPYTPDFPPTKHNTPSITHSFPQPHDTVSVITISELGQMAAATSTNGAAHKVPGRVGDGPIAGSGSYVDGEVGGCGATGDGDLMMRFLPCYQAVENMRRGMSPSMAAEDAVRRMLRRFPLIQAGLVVVDKNGRFGAAASNWVFTYSWRSGSMSNSEVVTVQPIEVLNEL